jgi:hypothetical protein
MEISIACCVEDRRHQEAFYQSEHGLQVRSIAGLALANEASTGEKSDLHTR